MSLFLTPTLLKLGSILSSKIVYAASKIQRGPSRYGTFSLLVGALDATVYPLTLEGTAHHALNHCTPTTVIEMDRP